MTDYYKKYKKYRKKYIAGSEFTNISKEIVSDHISNFLPLSDKANIGSINKENTSFFVKGDKVQCSPNYPNTEYCNERDFMYKSFIKNDVNGKIVCCRKDIQYYVDNENMIITNLFDSCGGTNWGPYFNKESQHYEHWSSGIVVNSIGFIVILDFSNLGLTGLLPSNIYNLQQLKRLNLSNNRLDGKIPPNVVSLKKILLLNLSNNRLQGTIPKNIFKLKTLLHLNLSSNQLIGSISENVYELPNLLSLRLNNNNLTGEIPFNLGKLKNLEYLFLDNNILTGIIPSSLGNIIKLKIFKLDNNKLSGKKPTSLDFLESISSKDYTPQVEKIRKNKIIILDDVNHD